jgi:GAF domain-containing protein
VGGKGKQYGDLAGRLAALLGDERDFVANAANTAALLYRTLPAVNWAGFYVLRGDVLVLGPFQGKPACVRIPLGKGVCGTAAARRETVVVPDVHTFPGHIACDPDSRSEIVLPLRREEDLWGVLDLDSPLPGRFDEEDRAGLEGLVTAFLARTTPPGFPAAFNGCRES